MALLERAVGAAQVGGVDRAEVLRERGPDGAALDEIGGRVEDRERLKSIKEQLSKVDSKEFWEIIDRGRNFEYMPPRQKEEMGRFFAMLDQITAPRAPSTT